MDISSLISSPSLASNSAGEDFLKPRSSRGPMTWIVTGERGVGKSTLCGQIAGVCLEEGLRLGGVLSSAVIENGEKTGITLQDLHSGETRLLGSRDPLEGYSLEVGCWHFDPQVLAWGNRCLQYAAGREVVIFDECGILELKKNKGFIAGMQVFDQQAYQLGLVVVRPELVPMAQERWPGAFVYKVEAEPV